MGSDRQWVPKNDLQDLFLKKYFVPLRVFAKNIPEITSIVSHSAQEINEFLAKNGFTIRLNPFGPLEFGTASIFDILLKWRVEGEEKDIVRSGSDKVYPGVRISSKNARFFLSASHPFPIAGLFTKTADIAYITTAAKAPVDEFELMDMIHHIENGVVGSRNQFAGVHFPKVDLQKMINIAYMLGMETVGDDGQPAVISQALMEAITKINQDGARAKVAAAFGIERCCIMPKSEEDMEVDSPFLFWIKRAKLPEPLFCAYITQDDWKDPGNIE